jgi:sigma-B regulation protein RsbU (phosphoserine phosphatase)
MRVLIVEDDPAFRRLLRGLLERWKHQVVECDDGLEAWATFDREAPDIVISDWNLPGMDGPELCRRLREGEAARERRGLGPRLLYLILLTARDGRASWLEGMDAGADDFLTKPVEPAVLEARLRVAQRLLRLHAEVRRLAGLLPVCAYCHRIREGAGEGADARWTSLESYVVQHSEATLSHGICPDCLARMSPPGAAPA